MLMFCNVGLDSALDIRFKVNVFSGHRFDTETPIEETVSHHPLAPVSID
jgi:hypothetical protein